MCPLGLKREADERGKKQQCVRWVCGEKRTKEAKSSNASAGLAERSGRKRQKAAMRPLDLKREADERGEKAVMRPLGLKREADERGEKAVMRPLDLLIVVDEARRKKTSRLFAITCIRNAGCIRHKIKK